MINKIIKIRGTGLLHDAISPAKKFSKINLIYGENGRGKTTFVNIFSSLSKNNPSIICARKTLDGVNEQEIELRINEKNYIFSNKNWNYCFDNISIFDSSFVDTNVYSGFNVSADHRKSLLNFTLGEKGGQLKKHVDEFTAQISEITSKIGELNTTIAQIFHFNEIKSYLEIKNDPKIDIEIQELEKTISSVRNVSEICKMAPLSELKNFIFDFYNLQQLLNTSLSQISETAKERVMDHMNSQMRSCDEQWIKDGFNLLKTDNCPFCGQNLNPAAQLIELYRQFFDESYSKYQEKLKICQEEIDHVFSADNLSRVDVIETNNSSIFDNVWRELILASYKIPTIKPTIDDLQEIKENYTELIQRKIANPTLKINDYSIFNSSKKSFEEILTQIDQYNITIQKINQEILLKKTELKQTDLIKIQNRLQELRIFKDRHTSPNKEICEQYENLVYNKSVLEGQKKQARSDLTGYTNDLLKDLEGEINKHLECFGAGYRIVNVNTSHEKGYPRINYKLQLREQNLEFGSQTDFPKEPDFSNSMSEGDKRTLAFAFFLAKTTLEPNICDKIIIVDDPMSSLDQSRQLATQTALKKLSLSGKQLIVLSHDPRFLQDFIDNSHFNSNDVTTFELQRCHNDYSILKNCNLEESIQSGYKNNYKRVSEYVVNGQCNDKFSVVRALRPLLEANLRYRLQDSLQNAENLGKMIGIIRKSQPGTVLNKVKPHLPQLDEINIYTTRLTHGTDGDEFSQQIKDAELQHYAKFVLEFTQGFS